MTITMTITMTTPKKPEDEVMQDRSSHKQTLDGLKILQQYSLFEDIHDNFGAISNMTRFVQKNGIHAMK
jgi:hypothetical protein